MKSDGVNDPVATGLREFEVAALNGDVETVKTMLARGLACQWLSKALKAAVLNERTGRYQLLQFIGESLLGSA